jgi:hypothetical protein
MELSDPQQNVSERSARARDVSANGGIREVAQEYVLNNNTFFDVNTIKLQQFVRYKVTPSHMYEAYLQHRPTLHLYNGLQSQGLRWGRMLLWSFGTYLQVHTALQSSLWLWHFALEHFHTCSYSE